MIGKALRYEINNGIPELKDSIYPTNAPEGVTKPYLVYARISTRKIKTLDGISDKQGLSYMFSVMAPRYSEMNDITKKVETLLIGMAQRAIGEEGVYIEDMTINNVDEAYEHNLNINRGIIDFTIYY